MIIFLHCTRLHLPNFGSVAGIVDLGVIYCICVVIKNMFAYFFCYGYVLYVRLRGVTDIVSLGVMYNVHCTYWTLYSIMY